jgi:hypothetical protein
LGLYSRGIGQKTKIWGIFALGRNLAKKSMDSDTYQIVARQKCYRMDGEKVVQG